jgi:hypothetical protein
VTVVRCREFGSIENSASSSEEFSQRWMFESVGIQSLNGWEFENLGISVSGVLGGWGWFRTTWIRRAGDMV